MVGQACYVLKVARHRKVTEKRLRRRPVWIPVVTAIIRRNDEFLLGLRPEGQSLAGAWEFPGGKINPGELPHDALKRELMEELGIDAEVGQLRMAHTHMYGDKGVLLLFFDVHFWKGEPKPIYHDDLRWSTVADLEKLNIPEANKKILSKIVSVLKTHLRP